MARLVRDSGRNRIRRHLALGASMCTMGMLGGMLGVAGSARAATHSGTAIAITAPTVNAPITISFVMRGYKIFQTTPS